MRNDSEDHSGATMLKHSKRCRMPALKVKIIRIRVKNQGGTVRFHHLYAPLTD